MKYTSASRVFAQRKDAPYFYEILADVTDSSDPRAQTLTLLVEGKEVGESRLVYDCETGEYSEKW